MSKIDPTRLPQVLAALSKPKEKLVSGTANNSTEVKPRKETKDLGALREHLQVRLLYLKKNTNTFHNTAPIITIQEILRWEFGDSILDHSEFGSISNKVAQTMLENQELEKAIYAVINELIPSNS